MFVDSTQPPSDHGPVDRLVAFASGDAARLKLTPAGEAAFRRVRGAVFKITDALLADLPPGDLDATHRTLTEVARRVAARAAADA